MTAGAVEEVDEEVNEGVDERSMVVSRDTQAEIDHQGQDEFHQQGERESTTNTKSAKKKPYTYNYATPDRPRPAAAMLLNCPGLLSIFLSCSIFHQTPNMS